MCVVVRWAFESLQHLLQVCALFVPPQLLLCSELRSLFFPSDIQISVTSY